MARDGKTCGEIAKGARKRAGLILQEAAERTGISTSALSQLENNQRNPLTPGEMVELSDAYRDTQMLTEYCDVCPVRRKIVIHKFPPLNNIDRHPAVSTMKLAQKLASAADKLQPMLNRLLTPGFKDDPEFREIRNDAVMELLHVRRGAEIVMGVLQSEGVLSAAELKLLEEMQQQHCVDRGYHLVDGSR